MILKGKAKKDFREWYNKRPKHTPIHTPYDVFCGKELSMQYGVLVDWFDSVGIVFTIEMEYDFVNECFENAFNIFIDTSDKNQIRKVFDTRNEARKASIEKAVEIYNSGNTTRCM